MFSQNEQSNLVPCSDVAYHGPQWKGIKFGVLSPMRLSEWVVSKRPGASFLNDLGMDLRVLVSQNWCAKGLWVLSEFLKESWEWFCECSQPAKPSGPFPSFHCKCRSCEWWLASGRKSIFKKLAPALFRKQEVTPERNFQLVTYFSVSSSNLSATTWQFVVRDQAKVLRNRINEPYQWKQLPESQEIWNYFCIPLCNGNDCLGCKDVKRFFSAKSSAELPQCLSSSAQAQDSVLNA